MNYILFSKETMPAVLDGRKTQTRRVVKVTPDRFDKWIPPDRLRFAKTKRGLTRRLPNIYYADQILWGREPFKLTRAMKDGLPFIVVEYLATDTTHWCDVIDYDQAMGRLKPFKNYPAMYMPKWASRFSVKVKDVRVERLHEITYSDIVKEGIEEPTIAVAALVFIDLWNKLHKYSGYSWEKNPWVQVVDFELFERKDMTI